MSFAVSGFGTSQPPQSPESEPFHFIGYQIFSRRILQFIPPGSSNILHDILAKAIAQGEPVRCEVHDDVHWFETGNEFDYLRAHEQLFAELVANPKGTLADILDRFTPGWNSVSPRPGVYLHRNSGITSANFPTSALIGPRCHIHPDAQFSKTGFLVLGESCEVREPCLLENVVMATGASTSARGHLSQALVSRPETSEDSLH